jgi:hypothetical protein
MHWLLQWWLNVKQLLFWVVLHKNVESNQHCFMAHHIAAVVVWQTNFPSCIQNITNVWSCCVTRRSKEGMSISNTAARTYGWTLFWLNLCSSNTHFTLQRLRFIWIHLDTSTFPIVKILHVVCAHYSMHVPFHELCISEYILSNTRDRFCFYNLHNTDICL